MLQNKRTAHAPYWMNRKTIVRYMLAGCISLVFPRTTLALPKRAEAKIGTGVRELVDLAVLEQNSTNSHVLIAIAFQRPVNQYTLQTNKEITQKVFEDVADTGYTPYRTYGDIPGMYGYVSSQKAIDKLALNDHVKKIDLDENGGGSNDRGFSSRKLLTTSVPFINADQRHNNGNTGNGVTIAVLDTGVDTGHPNFKGRIQNEACFADASWGNDNIGNCPDGSNFQVGPGAAEENESNHGSHVTGIIASNGSVGGVGVAPDASIVSIKVMYGPNAGSFSSTTQILDGLQYIIDSPELGVKIINMSLGTFALYKGDCDQSTSWNMLLADAINTLRNSGVLSFVSAGNQGSTSKMGSPACLSNVISVGNSDYSDNPYRSSNSGVTTDIFAPGAGIESSSLGGGLVTFYGTSMASPHAVGCAALLVESGDATTPQQIEDRLETSSYKVTIPKTSLTFPRIDCAANVCRDNPVYAHGGEEKKTCQWVARSKRKENLCKKNEVKRACQIVCGLCCEDDQAGFKKGNNNMKKCSSMDTDVKKKKKCKKSAVNTPCARTCGRCCNSDNKFKFLVKSKERSCKFIKNEDRVKKLCKGETKMKCGVECGCIEYTVF